MNAWWSARTAREKLILVLGAAIFAAFFYWRGLLTPLQAAAANAEGRYAQARADARAIAAARPALAAAEPDRDAGRQVLRAIASERAAAVGLPLARLQPEADGALSVAIEAAPPGQVFGWLALLKSEDGVEVRRLTVEKAGANAVQAQVTLQEGGG